MRLLTRVSVLLLAVALVPLLRFIDIDTCRNPSAAPFPVDGVSDEDSPGVVVDRKQNLRFVTRVRASIDGDDTQAYEDDEALLTITGWSGSSVATVDRLAASSVHALVSAPRGTPKARGPPT